MYFKVNNMNINFNKIVNKLLKKRWKIIFKKDIAEICNPDNTWAYSTSLNKVIYQLRSQKYIIVLKSWVYVIPSHDDLALNWIDLREKYFTQLLKKTITFYVWSEYYISWEKSLQMYMKNYSIPEKIYVVTRSLSKRIWVGEKCIIFKTVSGRQYGKKINLYNKFSSFTQNLSFEWVTMKFSRLEMALMESALIHDCEEWCDIGLLVQAIKKYRSIFDIFVFQELGKYKYIMAVNRLKEISKPLDLQLYSVFLEIIKQNGSCFIGEGGRNI